VLILGESGTGKELVADAIHRNSPRAGQPIVKINMGAITPSLFESEMFGHVRGAFTDARSDRKGHVASADGGTLFLDEIGELKRGDQVKLLRVLQDQRYQPVGASRSEQADMRVVSATNRELAELVASGEFREDLFYRLNLITIRLPPLRERRSDIPAAGAPHRRPRRRRLRPGRGRAGAQALDWLAPSPGRAISASSSRPWKRTCSWPASSSWARPTSSPPPARSTKAWPAAASAWTA
jgi:two-component system NtrC family response regulator